MAAFASSVKSILDIYSNCLLLLESLKKKSASDKASSRLRRSIRSDQAKIQNAYEKGLSRRGKSFSEGDGNWPCPAPPQAHFTWSPGTMDRPECDD